jgi:hypothetical protein
MHVRQHLRLAETAERTQLVLLPFVWSSDQVRLFVCLLTQTPCDEDHLSSTISGLLSIVPERLSERTRRACEFWST